MCYKGENGKHVGGSSFLAISLGLFVPLTQLEIAGKSDERIIYSDYRGDLNAVRELAAQFAEDMASDNVIYTEARFCPHLLVSNHYPVVSMYV